MNLGVFVYFIAAQHVHLIVIVIIFQEKKREGLVEFSCEEDLHRAYQRINGEIINGRRIKEYSLRYLQISQGPPMMKN